ncbi:MAG: fumarate hydratase [Candidatus Acididesulfobacter guangdongensis]|uniref:Fumarate hydratase n=1 Tax=Acididesulfobacter guangdongensis TaxID=2597225 RepID=A0A519BIM0_ACIG2|nr:MAG: fumarate hydratase [Candidatus Acididesulfobacter guangdongensis]
MKIIKLDQISNAVIDLITHAASNLSEDVIKSLNNSLDIEISESGKSVLNKIIKNAEIAKNEDRPLCQDTGLAVFFVEIGNDVAIEGGTITEGINEGTRKGYEKGYLRKSTCDPLTRKNLGDNTPAIIHYEFTGGDKLKISYAAKGGGSENMSRIKMMKPSDGIQGIIDFAVETMEIAGPNPCPPNIIGIGIGGNFERSAIIAKKALFRNIGTINPDKELAQIEQTIYNKINNIGTGPMGFGGVCTALAVHIIKEPCHIASMPVAINIECHSHRHGSVVL